MRSRQPDGLDGLDRHAGTRRRAPRAGALPGARPGGPALGRRTGGAGGRVPPRGGRDRRRLTGRRGGAPRCAGRAPRSWWARRAWSRRRAPPTWCSTRWSASPGCRSPWPRWRRGADWPWPTRSRSSPAPRWSKRPGARPAPRSSRSTPSTAPSTSAWHRCSRRPMSSRLLLTASGGPFRGWTATQLRDVDGGRRPGPPDLVDGPEDHHRLVDPDEQGTRGHRGARALRGGLRPHRRGGAPQSIVHSMVELRDGSVLAQLSLARHAPADRVRARVARPRWPPPSVPSTGRARRA